MRLLKFLQYSSEDEDTNKYRSLEIRMLDERSNYEDVVRKVEERYKTSESVLNHLKELNKELRKSYNGKWSFQLCMKEGESVDNILKHKNTKNIKEKYFKASEDFCNLKLEIERKIE